MRSYRSPILDRAGAVGAPDDSPDAGVPLHYGDPLAEQRHAASGAIIVDRSHHDVLEISGAEHLSLLEGLISQHVTGLVDGTGGESLLLDPNGRIEHHLVLAESADRLTVDTEPGRGAELLAFLQKMVFWADVQLEHSDLRLLTLAGAAIADGSLTLQAPDGTRIDLPRTAYAVSPLPGGGLARRRPWPEAGQVDLLVPQAGLADWFDAAVASGAVAAGTWALEALRIGDPTATGQTLRARLGLDTDERTIPHEAPSWIGSITEYGAVHLEKGCYRGQETVARVHNLGRSPRVLVRLHLDGSAGDLPAPGDPVTADGRPVGRIGSVVHHHELGPIALALLKRSVGADTDLDAGPVAARIDPQTAPMQGGVQAGREAVRRLRGS